MNTYLLGSKMTLFSDTVTNLAEYLEVSTWTLHYKMRGESEFMRDEIQKIIKRYNLTPEEVIEIFFTERSE